MDNRIYNKSVLVLANSNLEYNFALRLCEALFQIGYRCTVLTLKPSLYIKLKRKGIKSFLIRKLKRDTAIPELNKLIRISNNLLTKEEIITLYVSIFDHVQQMLDKNMIDIVFIWNGQGLTSSPLSAVANKNKFPRVYFELANIPGKLFVDPTGVNSSSSLYENINLLKDYKSSESQYLEWKENYSKYKSKNFIIPQVDKLYKRNNLLFPLDYLSCKAMITPVSGDYTLVRKFFNKFRQNYYHSYSSNNIPNIKYLFLPLQVDNDTQLVFNSDVNNIEAIKISFDLAKKKGFDLVVKPHPASSNRKEIEEVLLLKQRLDFVLTNKNTFDLLINAEEIVTINSSVGLDGLIFGKDVTFLGKSFYSNLNKEYLRNYILSYLINIDYFSNEKIDIRALEKVFERGTIE